MKPSEKTGREIRWFLGLALIWLCALGLQAAEVIPPRPTAYFNDYAGIVSPAVASQLNQRLEQFERDTSNQILVAIYPRMQSESSIDDYKVRVAQAWGVGQKGKSNGAVLFVFVQNHQTAIATGYGLEDTLPDGLCHLILANELTPRFRQGDYAGGLTAAINAMIAATRGEYRGTGRTHADNRPDAGWPIAIGFFLLVMLFSYLSRRQQRSAVYQSRGSTGAWGGPTMWWGGGGFGGFGGGGGGGGGFSAGGGGFGGGGASGSW